MAKVSPLMFVPPLAFAALAGLFLWGMQREDAESLPSAREGQSAPPVVVTQLGDKTLFGNDTLREDGVKLVNYWASWCAPCRVEHPNLETIAAEAGVPIYGVNYKDEPAKALKFLSDLGDPYAAIGADAKGRMALDWGVYGVPETYVIDADGRIVLRFAGPITESVMESRILPAIEAARD